MNQGFKPLTVPTPKHTHTHTIDILSISSLLHRIMAGSAKELLGLATLFGNSKHPCLVCLQNCSGLAIKQHSQIQSERGGDRKKRSAKPSRTCKLKGVSRWSEAKAGEYKKRLSIRTARQQASRDIFIEVACTRSKASLISPEELKGRSQSTILLLGERLCQYWPQL